uniref:Uncharacterized protein n=1 Tax=Solanum tuberosum TaxID=4113 RepID=M1DK95_SOLTU
MNNVGLFVPSPITFMKHCYEGKKAMQGHYWAKKSRKTKIVEERQGLAIAETTWRLAEWPSSLPKVTVCQPLEIDNSIVEGTIRRPADWIGEGDLACLKLHDD